MTLTIALDAMGGDKAPGEIIAGAKQAVEELGVDVLLVGQPEAIGDPGPCSVLPASEVIAMDEDAGQAVRRKKDSSLVRAAEAVRDGQASAMVSAGNTGATMASALFRMGRMKGVARPAIATGMPVPGFGPTVLLDSGANAECQPAWLVQFAQMGAAYARRRYGIDDPRVALLSIGEEDTKGNPLVKETHALLKAGVGVNFIGNVEGRDLMTAAADVVVTDGFNGNVALKTLEGSLKFFLSTMLGVFNTDETSKAAADVLFPYLAPVINELDPDSHGGAMLLGVDGVCIISHGSSSSRAIVNAIRLARDMVDVGLVAEVAASIRS